MTEDEEEIKIGWDEKKAVAEFILEHADDVMETWQVANALRQMNGMIKDHAKQRLLKVSSIIIVENFLEEMSKKLMEKENERKKALEKEEQEAKDEENNKSKTKKKTSKKKPKKAKKEMDSRPIVVGL